MAIKKYLDLVGLTYYDEKIRAYIQTQGPDITEKLIALIGASEKGADEKTILARLNTIEGGVEVDGSMQKIASDAVATVVAEAPEAFDTLKEIAEWISKSADNNEAFDAATRIVNLETAINDEDNGLAKRVADIEDEINNADTFVAITEEEIDAIFDSLPQA